MSATGAWRKSRGARPVRSGRGLASSTGPAIRNSQFIVPLISDLWEALDWADCAALGTRHREYYSLNLQRVKDRMDTPAIVDGRDVFALGDWLDAGFAARAVGKG